jgi:hypothetical protein
VWHTPPVCSDLDDGGGPAAARSGPRVRRARTVDEMVGMGFFPDEVGLPATYPDLAPDDATP